LLRLPNYLFGVHNWWIGEFENVRELVN